MVLPAHKTLSNLHNNSRFYVLSSSILLAVGFTGWLRLQIPSTQQLFYIRLEQVLRLVSVVYLYAAFIISPLSKLANEQSFMKYVLLARRAIGVSTALFASRHMGVALATQKAKNG